MPDAQPGLNLTSIERLESSDKLKPNSLSRRSWQITSSIALLNLMCGACRNAASPLKPAERDEGKPGYFKIAMREAPRCDIVFLHGLGGEAKATWKADGAPLSFYEMLAEDIPDANVWTIGYNASLSMWTGQAMELTDRAKEILSGLYARDIGTIRPLYLICHSLGGLVAKQMLQIGLTLNDDTLKTVANNITGIVFLGTPHRGSANADLLLSVQKIVKVTRFSESVEDLKLNSQKLLDLNEYFVREATKRGIDKKCLSFYERQKVGGVLEIVDRVSGDPGFATAAIARPSDASHLEICKPYDREDSTYIQVKKFLNNWIASSTNREVDIEDFFRRWEKMPDNEMQRDYINNAKYVMTGRLKVNVKKCTSTAYSLYPPPSDEDRLQCEVKVYPLESIRPEPLRDGSTLEFSGELTRVNDHLGVLISGATVKVVLPK
jgi:pimeloyl-ACP methyl ester carboxylesterase